MYVTDVIWWAYVVFSVAVALLMISFVRRVTREGR